MGERLVIDIKRNNKSIAIAYYHWSAYTSPSINILHRMYKHVLSKACDMTDEQLQLALIRFAESSTGLGFIETEHDKLAIETEFNARMQTAPVEVREMLEGLLLAHGGISIDDLDFAKSRFPGEEFKLKRLSRNEGLIIITPEHMEEAKSWAQGIIDVDLDSGKVLNGIIYDYNLPEYMAEVEDDDEFIHPDDLPRSPIDLAKFQLDEVEIVKDVIDITEDCWIKFNDTIYQFING